MRALLWMFSTKSCLLANNTVVWFGLKILRNITVFFEQNVQYLKLQGKNGNKRFIFQFHLEANLEVNARWVYLDLENCLSVTAA